MSDKCPKCGSSDVLAMTSVVTAEQDIYCEDCFQAQKEADYRKARGVLADTFTEPAEISIRRLRDATTK